MMVVFNWEAVFNWRVCLIGVMLCWVGLIYRWHLGLLPNAVHPAHGGVEEE